MKTFIKKFSWYGIGTLAGALTGFLYWKLIGCASGSCRITSDPLNSTLYFAFFGALILGSFQQDRNTNMKDPDPSIPTEHKDQG